MPWTRGRARRYRRRGASRCDGRAPCPNAIVLDLYIVIAVVLIALVHVLVDARFQDG